MPVRFNSYFNSPVLKQGFSNLAQIFAPPSAAETLAYEKAGALGDQRDRQREAFEAGAEMFDPRFYRLWQSDPEAAIRAFPKIGTFLAAQDVRESGGDVASLDPLVYGTFGDYGNTVAGEEAALANALEEERLRQAGQTQRQLLEPITANENQTVILPPETAEATGLPGTLRGNINLAPGERTYTPDGRLFEGTPELPSETEVLGAILQDLSPEEQRARALQGVNVEEVVGTRGPEIVFRPDAVGREPFIEPGSPGTIYMYRTRDGREGRTTDGLHDMVTGDRIPPDAQISRLQDTSETFGSSEISGARENILARRVGVESMIRQANALDEMLSGADAGAAIGILGRGAQIINGLAAQIQAALQLAGVEAPETLRDAGEYQGTFRKLGIDNAKIQSALVDLAYATAQSREPGRLTEADIDRALRTIGGNLQDPIALRETLRSAVQRAIRDYSAAESVFRDTYGDALNLPEASFSELSGLPTSLDGEGRSTPIDGGRSASGVEWRIVE